LDVLIWSGCEEQALKGKIGGSGHMEEILGLNSAGEEKLFDLGQALWYPVEADVRWIRLDGQRLKI